MGGGDHSDSRLRTVRRDDGVHKLRWARSLHDPAAHIRVPSTAIASQLKDGTGSFTGITDFPTGFSRPFDVIVDGSLVGSFGPGGTVDFSSFPGGGVTSFTVAGISPVVDAGRLGDGIPDDL